MNMAPFSQLNTHLAKHVEQVATAFREGGGVPYAAYRPEFTDVMDAMGRGAYDGLLIDALRTARAGPHRAPRAPARSAADVACGTGHALVLLADAFPASTFTGYDLDDDAIARARDEAAGSGLVQRDASRCATWRRCRSTTPFDVVFVFDAIHDQVDPAGVLRRIHDALAPDGVLRHEGAAGLEQPRGQRRQPVRAAAVLGQHPALHDGVAGPRRGRARHRLR